MLIHNLKPVYFSIAFANHIVAINDNCREWGEAICASRQPLDEIAYCNSINALDRGNRWQEAIQQLQDMDSYSFLEDWRDGFMDLVYFPEAPCPLPCQSMPVSDCFGDRSRRHCLKPRFETQCFCV